VGERRTLVPLPIGGQARVEVQVRGLVDESLGLPHGHRAAPGDLVVTAVDDAVGVYREAMAREGAGRGATAFADPGELEVPEG